VTDFSEVAERVWVARHEWFDVNVTAIGSDRGFLVVDTHGSQRAARGVIDDLRRLGRAHGKEAGVVGVVNTHVHFDHTFGNAAFREAFGDIPIHAHETVVDDLPVDAERIRAAYAAEPGDAKAAEIADTAIVLPDHTFSSVAVVDLGDRAVELVHPGRGHTRGDVVVRVPDADVLLAGDLVEESAPPSMNFDSWPMDWPLALDTVLSLVTRGTVVVPGHGAPVDRDFVEQQRNEIGIVAETIRDLAGRGVPVDQALSQAEWPFPAAGLEAAVRRGYEQLPRSQKRLPLI
jgi:glyoxylase-like metal-dependent hydrolase (beta-lactamase superfamily II)